MSLQTTEYEINSALRRMSSEAQLAANNFARYLLINPSLQPGEAEQGVISSCVQALVQHGYDTSNRASLLVWYRNNRDNVVNVGTAIAALQRGKLMRVGKWIGRGILIAGGVTVGLLFL
jgi:hypothetical protein